jgi:hypothetical protein
MSNFVHNVYIFIYLFISTQAYTEVSQQQFYFKSHTEQISIYVHMYISI